MLLRKHALACAMVLLSTVFGSAGLRAEENEARPQRATAERATVGKVIVTPEVEHGELVSLRDTPALPDTGRSVHFEGLLPPRPGSSGNHDGALQSKLSAPTPNTPSPLATYLGIGQSFTGPAGSFTVGSAPPDTNGAVGATQYVQIVNSSFAVFNKSTGAVVLGPTTTKTLWSSLTGGCKNNNDGDGVVVYDKAANRWVVSQFSVSTTPYLQCVAVSKTSDATGGWWVYSFSYGTTTFPDYPKMGVWPDAYYETFNDFNSAGTAFLGANLCAYDRASMLTGAAATQQCIATSSAYGGILPSDLDGSTAPPSGAPNYMLMWDTNSLDMWKFHVDWTTPANTTLTGPVSIPVAAFSYACDTGGTTDGTCIPQKSTTNKLDSLSDRLMHRLAYRNFGDHEALVVSHSVQVGATTAGQTGVRWYELRDLNAATPTVYQQQSYSPDSSLYRWMPSIAMDRDGDIALGYSTSSSTANPSIAYTARLSTDALSTMGAEVQMFAGTGSQTGGLTRWGDYSAMTVDPVDDCTFWYTTEYLAANGSFNWRTRIGNFKFPDCGKTSQTITFTNPGPVTFAPSGQFSLGATASSGLAVTYTSNSTGVCTVSGSTVTIVTAGSCSISADQAGDATYKAAPTVTDAITIAKADQTISFPNPGPVTYSAGGTFPLGATASSGLSVSYTSTTTGVCTVSGTNVTLVTAGTCTINANQAGDGNYNAASQVGDDIAIAKADQTISFTSTAPLNASVGGTSYNVSATASSGLTVAFTIDASASAVCTISGSAVSFIGVGSCVIDADQAGDGNYNAAAQQIQSFPVAAGSGGGPAVLVITQQPGDGVAGTPLSAAVTVEVRDALGNVVIGDNNQVALNVSGPGQFDQTSTTTVAFSNGVATFDNLVFDVAGTGYALTAQDVGDSLTSAPSSSFAIAPGAPTLVFSIQPTSPMQGEALGTVQVTEQDAFGNLVPDDSSLVDFTVAACGGAVDLGQATMSGSQATLPVNTRFYTAATAGSLHVTASIGALSADSNGFGVLANPGLLFANGYESCVP